MFFDMTGETDAEEWIGFCKASCNIISASLNEDADITANEAIICNAAACHAFYMYVLRSCATSIATFKAVDMSVTNVNELTLSSAKTLFENAMSSISHLLRSTRFAFRSV